MVIYFLSKLNQSQQSLQRHLKQRLNMAQTITENNFLVKVSLLISLSSAVISEVPLSEFFPYTEHEGATSISFSDDSAHRISLGTHFRFLNHTYWQASISANGIITFGDNPFTGNSPNCAAPRHIPMIMVYLADGVPSNGARLMTYTTTSTAILRKAKQILISGFPNLGSVNPNWLFAITWYEIAGHDMPSRLRNTYQAILVFDSTSQQSFVILFYNKIEWVKSNFASVGFDGGNGQLIYTVPNSCTSEISNVARQSNVNSPGLWIFKVDTNIVSEISCKDVASMGQLHFEEKVVSVMGNVPLTVKGLCLDSDSNITCEFKDPSTFTPIQTQGIILLNSEKIIICPVPFLYSLGRITVDVLVSSTLSNYRKLYQGQIVVVSESDFGDQPKIFINKTLENSYLLTAHWDPKSMDLEKFRRLDNNDECPNRHNFSFVTVSLLEYDGFKWRDYGALTEPLINTGVLVTTFNRTRFMELIEGNRKILVRTFGLKASHTFPSTGLKITKMLPANIGSGMNILLSQAVSEEDDKKSNIFEKACQSWYEQEPIPNFKTLPCPISVKQVKSDWRFKLDESTFYNLQQQNSNASSTYIQQVPPTSGGATLCSYDDKGRLIIEAGRRILRSSPTSWRNYWAYYWNDVLPYSLCSRANKSYYIDKRLVSEELDYKFPKIARAVGLGHITTFDNLSYEVGVRGEFVMISQLPTNDFSHSSLQNFKMHLIFDRSQAIRAVVMQQSFDGHDINVQVYIDLSLVISVAVNKIILPTDFTLVELNFYYPGLVISFLSERDVKLTFATGFSFYIRGKPALNVIASMDPKWNGKIGGLWGNSDGDIGNDFMDTDGSVVLSPENATCSEIYEIFASSWLIDEENSLFRPVEVLLSMNLFEPAVVDWYSNCNYSTSDVLKIKAGYDHGFCGGDSDCEFDVKVTSNPDIAETTKEANVIFEQITEAGSLRIKRCPWISNGKNFNIKVDGFYENSTLQVRCKPGTEILPNVTAANFTCKSINGESKAQWRNGNYNLGILQSKPGLKICNKVSESKESEESFKLEKTTHSATDIIPVEISAAQTSHYSAVKIVAFLFGLFVFLVIVAIFIIKRPVCIRIPINRYNFRPNTRSESAYNFSETASVGGGE